jgi:short-subunit dehydrogenase
VRTATKLALLGGAVALGSAVLSRRAFDFTGKSVVIAGGSRGLGLIFARQLVARGARLALLARSERSLERAASHLRRRGGKVLTIPCDVRNQVEVEAAIALVERRLGRIDVLINNAGVMQVGPVDHMGIPDFENAMRTHFWGPLFAMLEVIPAMRRRGGGRIVNIASFAGRVAVPHMAPYVASKHALVGLSEAMRIELSKDNIHVTTVCPWLMRIGSIYGVDVKGQHEQEFAWFALGGSLPLVSMNAELAAKRILKACERGTPRVMLAPQGRFASAINELMPGLTAGLMGLIDRSLPAADLNRGDSSQTGWESRSWRTPPAVTALSDQAAALNNEMPHARIQASASPKGS